MSVSDLSDQRVHLMHALALNDDQLLAEKADNPNYTLGRRRVQDWQVLMMMVVGSPHFGGLGIACFGGGGGVCSLGFDAKVNTEGRAEAAVESFEPLADEVCISLGLRVGSYSDNQKHWIIMITSDCFASVVV